MLARPAAPGNPEIERTRLFRAGAQKLPATTAGQRRLARRQHGAQGALQIQLLRRVVVFQPGGGDISGTARDLHLLVGADPFLHDEEVQELTAHHHRQAGSVLARDFGVAQQLHFTAVAIGQGLLCAGQRDAAIGTDGTDARHVDLGVVGGRKVAQAIAVDAQLLAAGAVEALHRELRHRVVGVARDGARFGRRLGNGRVFQQPPGGQCQRGHQGQRQVGRKLQPAAPGGGRHQRAAAGRHSAPRRSAAGRRTRAPRHGRRGGGDVVRHRLHFGVRIGRRAGQAGACAAAAGRASRRRWPPRPAHCRPRLASKARAAAACRARRTWRAAGPGRPRGGARRANRAR
jgi:hypothetical protein